ncbi:triacylglycerol lipase 2-like [Mangifera indica]|uniref:triacylglycerol lipase 2-like n=1 Tax=Mangifera indica TaxID=29780 RepID=UPI001CF9EEB6|nr:triacylglycerol lipase 2-like [Mangifera indica]
MGNATTTLILVLAFYVLVAAAARTKFYKINAEEGEFSSPPPTNDSICKTMVEPWGYICHEHNVTTKDGYILSLQRMPNARSGAPAKNPPVLLQHGLLTDGITWLLNSPDESLAFILADNGYDVWIANTRGTKYSSTHVSLTPQDEAYWEWSWDELVTYDLTAFVQFVHNNTGKKVHYVGHSLGTLLALASFSENKLLNMIQSAALLSPIAHMANISSPLTRFAAKSFLGEELYWLGLHEFSPRAEPAVQLLEDFCSQPGINCSDVLVYFTGENCCINSSTIDVFLKHEPQPTATKNMIHLAQMIRTGTIAMYDYGAVDNMNHYGQTTPPVYNMTSIPNDIPLFIGYGGKDSLADPNDVKLLLQNLKYHSANKMVVHYVEDYAHADFVFGSNGNQLVYNPIMAFFGLNST